MTEVKLDNGWQSARAKAESLRRYSHANVRDRYDADLLMAGFQDGASWALNEVREALEALASESGPIDFEESSAAAGIGRALAVVDRLKEHGDA